MKRREALKNLGLATGFFVATPSIISLLQSCTAEAKTWTPEFLSIDEGVVLTNLVDIILPKTDIPSATEVNVPQFIDKYFNEVYEDDDQAKVKTAFSNIIAILKPNSENAIDKVTQEDYKALLNNLKWMTINTYRTTQEIGENVLAYDPVPGAYFCGDLQELTGGKSWSL